MIEGNNYNYINRSKIVRRILQLKREREINKDSTHKWSETDLYDQIIGELEDLIT